MRRIWANQMPAAEHAAIFSWDPYQSMGNPSNLMGLSIHCVRFYDLWWRQPPKPNLEHYSSIAKRGWFLNSPLRTLAIHNQKYRSTETTQQPLHCKQHHQMETILGHGKEIFLNMWKNAQDVYSFKWYPRMENLVDYQSKHQPGAHHTVVWPYYLHEKNSPLELPHEIRPSTLKGFVGTLNNGYIRNVPLPQVLWIQSASPMKSHELIAPKVGI
jgi:hypothetical protein